MDRTWDDEARTCPGLSRRDFLRVGGLGVLGTLSNWTPVAGAVPSHERSLILLMLVGGPSQLETWDPKPEAPAEIRGPFGSIATTVSSVRIGEHLPELARRMDRLTLVRSLSHDAAPIHETGHQLVQTGRLCRLGEEAPHLGSVAARVLGARSGLPPFVMLPGPIGNTGVAISHGQSAGVLGPDFEPFCVGADPAGPGYDGAAISREAGRFLAAREGLGGNPMGRSTGAWDAFDLGDEPDALRDRYGRNRFGQSCLLARRLVEAGVRVVCVNMFETVFNRLSWDCHGSAPFSTLGDYAGRLLPTFDAAFSALLDDLDRSGLLASTLVVATGEFGRTPRLNAAGGRDHWPGVWSAAMAGGGLVGGRVIGASDPQGAEPVDRPVSPADLVATAYRSLGIDPGLALALADGATLPLVDGGRPIAEAFA